MQSRRGCGFGCLGIQGNGCWVCFSGPWIDQSLDANAEENEASESKRRHDENQIDETRPDVEKTTGRCVWRSRCGQRLRQLDTIDRDTSHGTRHRSNV